MFTVFFISGFPGDRVQRYSVTSVMLSFDVLLNVPVPLRVERTNGANPALAFSYGFCFHVELLRRCSGVTPESLPITDTIIPVYYNRTLLVKINFNLLDACIASS